MTLLNLASLVRGRAIPTEQSTKDKERQTKIGLMTITVETCISLYWLNTGVLFLFLFLIGKIERSVA